LLNPEEKRHAQYQGVFKWFVYERTRQYEEFFLKLGVFDEKKIVRMQDTRLIAEFTYAILNGIETTKSAQLDKMYKTYDREFPQQEEISARLKEAMDVLILFPEIHNGPLMKPHIFLTLLIALSQTLRPTNTLEEALDIPDGFRLNPETALSNLTALSDALAGDVEGQGKFNDFVHASAEKTNVESQRKKRVEWLGKALLADAL
jgi:hypothetical protein